MSFFEQTKVTDSSGVVIDPASESTLILLRRIVKLLESSAVVDSQQRQRVTVDNSPAVTVASTTIASGTITTVSTLSAITTAPVDQRYQVIDGARAAYNLGIRSNLTFT